jgi:hypothetical protein
MLMQRAYRNEAIRQKRIKENEALMAARAKIIEEALKGKEELKAPDITLEDLSDSEGIHTSN